MLAHMLRDDRQPEAGAVAESAAPARGAPREPLEDPVPLLGSDARPGVLDEEAHGVAVILDGQQCHTAGVALRVLEQVGENPLETTLVHQDVL